MIFFNIFLALSILLQPDGTTEKVVLPTGIYPISEQPTDFERYSEKYQANYYVVSSPIIALERFVSTEITKAEDGIYGLHVVLDQIGKEQLTAESSKSEMVRWAFIVRDELFSVATVMQPITVGELVISSPDFTKKNLKPIQISIGEDMEELKK